MKRILSLALVIAITPLVGSSMEIRVNGVKAPPDAMVTVAPLGTVQIDIFAPQEAFQGQYGLGMNLESADALLDISHVIEDYKIRTGDITSQIFMYDDLEMWAHYGLKNYSIVFDLVDTIDPMEPVLNLLVSHIEFIAGNTIGDVTIQLLQANVNDEPFIADSQVIHIVPEPVTMVLLGLGGLMLRRRK